MYSTFPSSENERYLTSREAVTPLEMSNGPLAMSAPGNGDAVPLYGL